MVEGLKFLRTSICAIGHARTKDDGVPKELWQRVTQDFSLNFSPPLGVGAPQLACDWLAT